MLPWTCGQELKLRAGKYLAELGYGRTFMENTFFKIEPQALYNDQIFFCYVNI